MTEETKIEVVIDEIGGNCPVEAEGTINDWPFYFRARGSHWSLEVAEPGFWACGEAVWEYSKGYGVGQAEAGWMTEEEARGFIDVAAALFVEFRKREPAVDGTGRTTANKLRKALTKSYDHIGFAVREADAAKREVVKLSRALGLDPSQHGMAVAQVDYQSKEWAKGYRDGYLGKPRASHGGESYNEGHMTGYCEQDAPKDMIDPALWRERMQAKGILGWSEV